MCSAWASWPAHSAVATDRAPGRVGANCPLTSPSSTQPSLHAPSWSEGARETPEPRFGCCCPKGRSTEAPSTCKRCMSRRKTARARTGEGGSATPTRCMKTHGAESAKGTGVQCCNAGCMRSSPSRTNGGPTSSARVRTSPEPVNDHIASASGQFRTTGRPDLIWPHHLQFEIADQSLELPGRPRHV